MFKKLMVAVVCGGVAMTFGAGCSKADKAAAKDSGKPEAGKPTAVAQAPAVPAVDPATVLVAVGDEKLTVGEADKQIMAMLGPQAAQMQPGQMEAMMGRFRQQAAERFVIRSLLNQEADKRKIKGTDKDVDEAIAMIKNRLPKDMTLEDVLKRENMTLDSLRSNMVGEIRIKLLVESEVPTNSVVTDADVAKFYDAQKERFVQPETVSARHILIKMEAADADTMKAEKKAKIEGLRKQLVEGADFEKLAKENSDCPSKERGGDLGSFPRGQMVKAFEDAAFSQATNAVGPVIETQFGFHIIQVTAHETGKTTPLAEVKDKLMEHLKQQKQMELFEAFTAKLKKDAKITYSDLAKPAPEMSMPMMQGE
jgi:peptidyl-prolyl cis-trans isomerase C